MKIAEANQSFFNISGFRLDSKSEERMGRLSEVHLNQSSKETNSEELSKSLSMPRFWLSLGILYLLSLVNLIISFTLDEALQMIFYVFISSSILLIPLCVLSYKKPRKSVLVSEFLIFNLHLIFSNASIYSPEVSPITCLELLIPSILIHSSTTPKPVHLFLSLLSSMLGFGLLLSSRYLISRSCLQFTLTLVLSFYCYCKSGSPLQTFKAEPALTPLEDILEMLHLTVKNLNSLSDNCGICRAHLDSVNENILNVLHKLLTSKNIYSAQIEKITKGMDAEDKVFIEQNAHESDSFQSFRGDLPFARRTRSESAIQVSKLGGVLRNLGKEWNFNTFFLKECAEGNPLEVAGLFTLTRFKLDSTFQLKEPEIFLKDLESRYLPNPYHNSCHGADVMNSYLFLLTNSEVYSSCTDLELLAGIISSLGHDVGHPARNNRFLVTTKDEIAIQYNDVSVLENMHSTIVFQLIQKNQLLEGLTGEQWIIFRKISIEIILATDMSKHFDIIETFKTKCFNSADLSRADVRFDLFKMIIKASDIGHAAKTIDLHKKWCEQVIEEFYTQGDLEKKLGLPVSMYCDRETTNIGKSQSGFIKNIVLPLFITLNSVLGSKKVETMCINQLEENKNYWESFTDISRKHTFVEKLETQHTVLRRRSSLPIKQSCERHLN